MIGQHAEQLRQPIGIQRLDGLANAGVQCLPLRLALILVRHVLRQRMLEHVRHFGPDTPLLDQVGGDQRMNAIVDRTVGIDVRDDTLEHAARKFPPNHRRDVQHVARTRIEPLEARQDDVLHRIGNVDRFLRLRQTNDLSLSLERPAFLKRSDHLFDEEWVAVRLRIEKPLEVV